MGKKLTSDNIGIKVDVDPMYIKALVQQQSIPMQKKYMMAALKSLCLSCEHCDYCPKKTEEVKCLRFQNYVSQYQKLLINELL